MWSARGRSMSPGPSHQAEQKDRLAVLKNEQAQHQAEHEPSTYHAMANLDTGITPSRVGKSYVSGSEQAVQYPAAAGFWSSDYARLPDEPALGWSVEAQEANGTPVQVAASIAALSAPASASVTNVVAGKAEVAAPTLVDHPSANVVERTSASSLISSASAERDQAPEGVQTANNIVRGSLHPTLSRPRRRL